MVGQSPYTAQRKEQGHMAIDEVKQVIEDYKTTYVDDYYSYHDIFKNLADEQDYDDFDVDDTAMLERCFDMRSISSEHIDDFRRWFDAQIKYAAFLASMGAEYLDAYMPDWRERVSENLLSMASGTNCILGQAFGDYDRGINQIYRDRLESGEEFEEGPDNDVSMTQFSRAHGFIDNGACYLALDYAWQDELRKRR